MFVVKASPSVTRKLCPMASARGRMPIEIQDSLLMSIVKVVADVSMLNILRLIIAL